MRVSRWVGLGLLVLAAVVLAAPQAVAWTGSDAYYNARDNTSGDGGPTNLYSSYDFTTPGSGWTCPAAANTSSSASANVKPASFSMKFYGAAIPGIYLASDGYVGFEDLGGSSAFQHDAIPDDFYDPNAYAAVFHGDTQPNAGASGYVCYRVEGSGTDERFIAIFDNAAHVFSTTTKVNALGIFYERGDIVEFHYGSSSWYNEGRVEGIGIEGNGGLSGIQYKYSGSSDATAIVLSTEAVQFRPTTSFPKATADTYTLDWGSSHKLKVDGSDASHEKVIKNDQQLGNVAVKPVYVSGLTSGEHLDGTADCTGTTPTMASDGAFCWTTTDADPCAHGDYTFKYRADDAFPDDGGGTPVDVATVTISVTNCNKPPVPAADAYTVTEDTTYSGSSVLTNDSDPDTGDTVDVAVLVAGSVTPAGATLTLNSDGTFSYRAPTNACAPATGGFDYKAKDNHGLISTTSAHVTLTITCTADTPTATADAYTTSEDTRLDVTAALGVRANDADADDGKANESGNGLAYTTAVVDTAPLRGTLTLGADGSFSYAPAPDFNGVDSFQYHLRDANTGLATRDSIVVAVTLTVTAVNDAPVGAADSYRLVVDETLEVIAAEGVLANDADVEANALTAELYSAPSGGTVTLASDGSFVYTPDSGRTDPDFFTYRAKDALGAFSGITRVDLVIDVPNPDLIARADRYTVAEDVVLAPDVVTGLLSADTIADLGDPLSVLVDAAPSHGDVDVADDGTFAYTPARDFNGVDSFTYHLRQPHHGESNIAKVTITVTSVNDAPIATAPTYACIAEDALMTQGAASGLLSLASDDHAGAPDEDDTPLSLASVTLPAHGSLAVNMASGAFTYTPTVDYNGADSIMFRVQDASFAAGPSLTVAFCVDPKPDAPVAFDDVFIAYSGATRTLAAPGPLVNDRDVDGDFLFVAGAPATLTGSQGGRMDIQASGAFSYTPRAGFTGNDDFTYRAYDGALASVATGRIRMDVRYNTPPVAELGVPTRVQAGQLFRVSDTSHDIDGPLVARAWDFGAPSPPGVTPPEHRYAYPGTYTIRLTVTDEAGATATAARAILVDPAVGSSDSTPNPDPTSSGPHDYTTEAAVEEGDVGSDDATTPTTPGDTAASGGAGAGAGAAADGVAQGGDADESQDERAPLPLVTATDVVGLSGEVRLGADVLRADHVAWRQVGGPTVLLAGADTASPSFTGGPGAYTFEVVATNGAGSVTGTVHVTLEGPSPGTGQGGSARSAAVQAPLAAAATPSTPTWAWAIAGLGALLALGLVGAIVMAARRR